MANFSVAVRNTMLDAIDTTLDATPRLRIYSGTKPTNADTALGAQVLLADVAISNFNAAASGQIALPDPASVTAAATGTATWFSLTTSAGVRVVDGTVGTSGAELNLNTVSIVSGGSVDISSLTLSIPA